MSPHILARDRHVCAYCAQRFRVGQLDMEHILPISKAGASNRKILADQMEFLLLGVPKSSRVHVSM